MSEEQISKKDLLQLTGISYGQLYRWKRKNIIPEEWFIKKSSFTGQETFFPKEKILERIEKIKELKDDQSLDDIARAFSNNTNESTELPNKLLTVEQIPNQVIQIYKSIFPSVKIEQLGQLQLSALLVVNEWLLKGTVTIEEVNQFLKLIEQYKAQIKIEDTVILFIRKFGVGTWVIGKQNETYVDQKEAVIINVDFLSFVQNLLKNNR